MNAADRKEFELIHNKIDNIKSDIDEMKTDMAKAAAQAIKDPNTPFYNVGVKPDLENPAFFARNFDKLRKQARKYLTVQGEMPDRFSAQLNQLKVAEVSAHNN